MLVTGWEGSRVTDALAWASLAAWSCWEVAGGEINSGVALEREGGRWSFTVTLSNCGHDENDVSGGTISKSE